VQIEAPPAVVESLKMTQFDKVIIGGRATLQAISGNDQFMNELAKREPNHPQANSLQASILMVPGGERAERGGGGGGGKQ